MSSTVETAMDLRPFRVDIPDEALEDLRRRIAATNWPEKETVADQSQGVPLAMVQKLARYWMTTTRTGAAIWPRSPAWSMKSTVWSSSIRARLASDYAAAQ